MSVSYLKQSLPDVHRLIFDLHRQVAFMETEYSLGDLLHERAHVDIAWDYSNNRYVYNPNSDRKKEDYKLRLDDQIEDRSSRIIWLDSFSYL